MSVSEVTVLSPGRVEGEADGERDGRQMRGSEKKNKKTGESDELNLASVRASEHQKAP